ncbi:MAG: class IV adenylate cyclase [Pirellulales bacterium]
MTTGSWEVELKFHIDELLQVEQQLATVGFVQIEFQRHQDCYYRHPCRDFIQTDEAFRIRCVNDDAMVTYKGPRHAGPVKTREEIELMIQANQLGQWKTIVEKLGFSPVVPVRKTRRVLSSDKPEYSGIHVTLDNVEQLGLFAEIEIVVHQKQELQAAEKRVTELAKLIGLERHQPRSYLSLLQEKIG